MATKKNLKVSEAKKIADKLKSKLSKKTIARYKAQGQNNPQSKSYTEVADEGEKSKRIGMRWTDDGAKKAGKKPNSPVSAADKEKYGGKTFKGKLKGKEGKVDRRYIYTERRVDKSDKSASAKFKEGGKVRQKGSQSGNPTPSMDKVHQAKPVGWRFRGNKYRKPSEAHINRQLKLSPDERDIYFERRKDKSDYDFDRRFARGGNVTYGSLYERIVKAVMKDVDVSREDAENIVDKNETLIIDMIDYEGVKNPSTIANAITSDYGEYKSGGKVRQKGSQSGNPTPSMDKVHQAKPVGWRFRGNKYRQPSEAHINRQLKLSPDERDIYFERRKDKSDYSFERRFGKGGGVSQFDSIMKDGVISEKEINLIKRRLNADKNDISVKEVVNYIWDEKPKLTSDQNKKGLEYLMNLWKSKMGKERVNNPFGYREQEALETFEDIQLSGFHDISMYNQRPYYVPLYIVNGKDSSFEYYIDSKGVNIVGSEGMEVSDEYKSGGKIRQKGSQSGNPTPSMDKVHQAKPVGWRFRGNKYRQPSEAHIERQLKLSPDERDIYFERRKDKSDYSFERRFAEGGENDEYAKGGGVGDSVKFIKGFGYWDLTKYPYGGDFKRFNGGEEGVLINGYRKYGNEIVVKLNDGRKIITQIQSIDLPNFEMKSDLLDRNKHLFEFGYAEGGDTDEYARGGGVTEQVIKIDVNGMLFFSLREFFDYCDANIDKEKNVDFSIEYVVGKYKTKWDDLKIYFVPNTTFNKFKREITEKYSEYNWSKMADGGVLSTKDKIRLREIDRQIKEELKTISEFEEDDTEREYDRFGNPSPLTWNQQVVMSAEENLEKLQEERKALVGKKMADGGMMAKGGGVPKEFGGRYNGVHNNIGRDVEMDRNWVAKPVGYRFTDKFVESKRGKGLGLKYQTKPTPEQVEKYRGKGVYFENREDKSDLKPSNRYPSYMSGGTTDGNWVSAYARGGVERISNRDARDYAENMLPFKGANLEGKTLSNGDYVVLSYGYYPIWYYCKHEGKWYGNSTKYSVTTSKQMTQSRPTYDATMLTRNELEQRMLKGSEKYAEGGVLDAILGNTDGATMQNVGGTTFSNADLTSHMDITNPTF